MTMLGQALPGAHSIRPRISGRRACLALLVLACAIVVAAAAQSYSAIEDELTDGALSRRGALAEVTAAALSGRFEQLTDVAVALATRVRFRSLVTEGKWGEAADVMRAVPKDFPLVDRLFVTAADGTLMATVPEHAGIRGVNLAHQEWYQAVRRGTRAYVSPVYSDTDGGERSRVLVATAIRGPNGEEAGMLILGVRMEQFLQWAQGLVVSGSGSISVVDSKSRIIFHSRSPERAETIDFAAMPIAQKLARGERGVDIVRDPVGLERVISAYAPVGAYGWGVVVDEPVRVAFAARDRQLRRLLMAYGLTLALVSAVLYLILRLAGERKQAARDRHMKEELEQRVTERTAELEATNKELESFSYSVSHDLRAPLRAIDGFSLMLEEDHGGALDEQGRRLLGVIRDSSAKMARLIDDLLAFSRLGRKPLSVALVDMRGVVDEALKRAHGEQAHAKAQISVHPLPPAWCDRNLILQVWCNLISNAIKFSARAGDPQVEVSADDDGKFVIYSVKDNGAGFDMRYYDKLFGVFQRLHSDELYPGTGVGLAIVQRIVTRHGGRVWAEGKAGEGAVFHFSLRSGASFDEGGMLPKETEV